MNIIQDLTRVNITHNGLKQVRGIVLHSMGGFYNGSISWFKNPASQVSAHYLISKGGEVRQMVKDSDMAWHAGVYDAGKPPSWALPNPNHYTLGIEFEDEAKGQNWVYPEAEKKAGRELVAHLMQKYGFGRDKVLLHKFLVPSRRSDPVGNFSFDWIFGATPPVSNEQKLKDLLWYNNAWWNGLFRVKQMRNVLPQSGTGDISIVRSLLWYDNPWWNGLYRVKEMRRILPK